MKFIKKYLAITITVVTVLLILLLSVKGQPGNPTANDIITNLKSAGKPFELSPERNRYSQLLAIFEYNRYTLPLDVAKIVVPDLGIYNGNYVSIYPPGFTVLSFPFYLLGKSIGYAQLATSIVVVISGVLSFILLYLISKKLEINMYSSLLAAFIFLFSTSAWAYTTTMYQHLITTTLLLGMVLIYISKINFWKSGLFWSLYAVAAMLDYPNIIFFMPLAIALIFRNIDISKEIIFKLRINYFVVFSAIFALPIILLWGFYNYKVFNNPIKISATATAVREISNSGEPVINKSNKPKSKTSLLFFDYTRFEKGTYTLLISRDRGLLFFSPVMILSVLGLNSLIKRKPTLSKILLVTVFLICVVYASWGDPWGGWAFGPRYLIPGFAIMSLFLAEALSKFAHKIFFTIIFSIVAVYSICINALGALTTNQIPPKYEAIGLNMNYNFYQNLEYLYSGISGSYIYNYFLKETLNVSGYFIFVLSITLITFIILVFLNIRKNKYEI